MIPYLYGDKLKAYLLAGARPLRGVSIYPDIRVGSRTVSGK